MKINPAPNFAYFNFMFLSRNTIFLLRHCHWKYASIFIGWNLCFFLMLQQQFFYLFLVSTSYLQINYCWWFHKCSFYLPIKVILTVIDYCFVEHSEINFDLRLSNTYIKWKIGKKYDARGSIKSNFVLQCNAETERRLSFRNFFIERLNCTRINRINTNDP